MVNEPLISYARELRKNQTKAEEILWSILRNRKFDRLKFRRQHPIYPKFILDFYCPTKKLAIEVDGKYHDEINQKKYDEMRTRILNAVGIKVVRFKNEEVLNERDRVMAEIMKFCCLAPGDSS